MPKKDVVIKEPEEKTHLSLREQATPLSKGNRLLSKNETATYRGIENFSRRCISGGQ